MKKTKTHIEQYIKQSLVVALLLLSAVAISYLGGSRVKDVKAGSQHNLSGYAWSENVGWLSFNCTNTSSCTTSDYGVNIDTSTGNFTGYAWSDSIGWVSFNSTHTSSCPTAPCQANLNWTTGAVVGWAKAIGATGGWDGWIRLSGLTTGATAYGVSKSGNTFTGYAWGSDVVGWLNWGVSGSYGGVSLTPSLIATISSPSSDISSTQGSPVSFSGSGTGGSGTISSYEWRESNCSTGTLLSSLSAFSKSDFTVAVHTVYLRVKDSNNVWSTNCPSRSITVGSAPVPTVSISANPTTITIGESSTLTWSSTDATSCTSSGGWTGARATSGSLIVVPGSTTTYTLSCTGAGGTGNNSATVTLNSTPTASITNPVSNIVVNVGDNVSLSGTGTDTDGSITNYEWRESICSTGTLLSSSSSFSKNDFAVGDHTVYFRVRDNSGTWSTNCPSRLITVNNATPPAITLSSSPTAVPIGESSTVTWSVSGATSCTASGGWAGSKALSGSQLFSGIVTTTTYILTCTGAGGDASASTVVSVNSCGNNVCDASLGETPNSCRVDCPVIIQEI